MVRLAVPTVQEPVEKVKVVHHIDNDGCCDGKDAYMKKLELDALKWSRKQSHIGTCMSIGMCLGISIGMCLGLIAGYSSDQK